jgi:hypothetical protein
MKPGKKWKEKKKGNKVLKNTMLLPLNDHAKPVTSLFEVKHWSVGCMTRFTSDNKVTSFVGLFRDDNMVFLPRDLWYHPYKLCVYSDLSRVTHMYWPLQCADKTGGVMYVIDRRTTYVCAHVYETPSKAEGHKGQNRRWAISLFLLLLPTNFLWHYGPFVFLSWEDPISYLVLTWIHE